MFCVGVWGEKSWRDDEMERRPGAPKGISETSSPPWALHREELRAMAGGLQVWCAVGLLADATGKLPNSSSISSGVHIMPSQPALCFLFFL